MGIADTALLLRLLPVVGRLAPDGPFASLLRLLRDAIVASPAVMTAQVWCSSVLYGAVRCFLLARQSGAASMWPAATVV